MKHKLIFSKLVFIIYFFIMNFSILSKILLPMPNYQDYHKLSLKRSKQTFTDLIISADVQGDGQTLVGLDACKRSVQRQLSYGDSHTVGAQVSQSKDTLTVCEDDSSDIRFWPENNDKHQLNNQCYLSSGFKHRFIPVSLFGDDAMLRNYVLISNLN